MYVLYVDCEWRHRFCDWTSSVRKISVARYRYVIYRCPPPKKDCKLATFGSLRKIIINTDTHTESGSHWLAIHFQPNYHSAYYFCAQVLDASWLSPSATPTPFNVCFDCRLGCLRQGYQSGGGTGLPILLIRILKPRGSMLISVLHLLDGTGDFRLFYLSLSTCSVCCL